MSSRRTVCLASSKWDVNECFLTASQAKAEGADLIEFDIALTKCGKAVLMHDDDLDRTTNMTGPILSKTFLDLATINVSHKFKRIV